MSEANKILVRRFVEEVWSKGNLHVADEVVAKNYAAHLPTSLLIPEGPGREGLKQFVKLNRAAFPDLNFTIKDILCEGDKVVNLWTVRGTHQGDLGGIPAAGKQITVSGISINRVSVGKIEEEWGSWDTLAVMQQLGVLPNWGRAATRM